MEYATRELWPTKKIDAVMGSSFYETQRLTTSRYHYYVRTLGLLMTVCT